MIVGAGMDIVEIDRIQRIHDRFGKQFARRILCDSELHEYHNSRFQVRYLAKRFAAKEAASKALGTGFSDGITPTMICVEHNADGMPMLALSRAAQQRASSIGADRTWISISDEKQHAAAFVILEKQG